MPTLKEQRTLRNELLTGAPLMEDRLRRAGLLKSAVMMNRVVQIIGFEVAEIRALEERGGKVFATIKKRTST